jgi:nucleoside-diphosphate-sugar epimerase
LADKKTNNQIFNIGSSEPKNMIELKDMLIEIGKEKNILPKDYNPEIITGSTSFIVDVQLRIPSTEKIQKTLGWKCKTNFKSCFEKFVDYKQNNPIAK